MGTIDSLKFVLTQSALNDLCEKNYIPNAVYPELPGLNARIRRSPTSKINLSVIAAAKISHFEILCCVHGFVPTVDAFVFPLDVPWHSGKTLRKDPPPTPDEFSTEVCDFLIDNPTLFKKFLKAFLYLVGISRYYTLDENYYPTFWDDKDKDMDLFAFIHHADPTKVKVGEREIREGEVPLLELTKDRVVPLAGVDDRGNAAAVGNGNDDVNEGSDDVTAMKNTEQSGHVVRLGGIEILADDEAQALVADKTKKFRKRKTADGAGGSRLPPKKLREDHNTSGDAGAITAGKSLAALQDLLDKSILAAKISATSTATVPFDTSSVTTTPEHEGGKDADSVFAANVRTKCPAERSTVSRSTVPILVILTAAVATSVVAGTSISQPREPASNDISSKSFYVSLDMDSEALRQAYVPKWDMRTMKYDQLFNEFNVGAARQTCLSAKVRMRLEHVLRGKKRLEGRCVMQEKLLKEKDVEIADLKAHLSLKEAEAAKSIRLRGQIADVEASKAARLSCDDLSIEASTFECEKDKLIDQATCFGLRKEVSGYKLFKERIEEMQDDGLAAGIDHGQAGRVLADVSAYNPSMEANYLTAINDLYYVDFPLLAQLESRKDASIIDIIDLLHLEGSAAKTLEGSQLQPSPEQLMVPIHRLKDQVVIRETSLSFSLEVAHNRKVSTSGVSAVTTAPSTTFSQASIILLASSFDVPPYPRIVSEQEKLNVALEHASVS
nr:transposase (putative), gypsy type [Tanacetum cinerariifolium]